MLRAISLSAAILMLFSASAPSRAFAAEAGFAGTWNLDLQRSDPRRQGQPLVATQLTIQLAGEDLTTTRHFGGGRTFAVTYITDGKPHEVESPLGSQTLRSKWKKDKLTVSYTVTRGGNFELDVTESWAVKDGELVMTFSSRVGDRNIVRKEIWVRASG